MLLNWKTAIVRVYVAVRKSVLWPNHVMPRYEQTRERCFEETVFDVFSSAPFNFSNAPLFRPSDRSPQMTTICFSSTSRLNLDFRESKPKFLSRNSFSIMAEITPTTIFTCCIITSPSVFLQFICYQHS